VDAEEEWELKMAVMRADLANKEADTRLKRRLTDLEPWKIVLAAAGAGAALAGAVLALGIAIGHWLG